MASSYNLRVGVNPGGGEVVSPLALASGHRLVAVLGNAGSSRQWRLSQLQPGRTYYWNVQSVDAAYEGSAFTVESSFALPPPAAAVLDSPLVESNRVRLRFTGSPGWSYGVLAATNTSLPASQWTRLTNMVTNVQGRAEHAEPLEVVPRYFRAIFP